MQPSLTGILVAILHHLLVLNPGHFDWRNANGAAGDNPKLLMQLDAAGYLVTSFALPYELQFANSILTHRYSRPARNMMPPERGYYSHTESAIFSSCSQCHLRKKYAGQQSPFSVAHP
jgi:hypothetical protein